MKTTSIELNLLTECINGSRTAQKQLYDMYKVKMYTLCLRYMSNKMDAEDMLQEGWVKVFKQLKSYNSEKGSFYGWIRKVFVNTNLEHLRKKKLKFEGLDDVHYNVHKFEPNIINEMSLREMVKLLQELPSGYRSVFNLYVIEGHTHKEVGEILGISPNTSKTQLMKAKVMMQSKVKVLEAV